MYYKNSYFCFTRFMLLGHVYIGSILEVIISRCLIFSYLSLFNHYFRIPDAIPHPYTDAFHIYYTKCILILFVCIVHLSIFELYVLSIYSLTNFPLFRMFNIMNINLKFNSGEQADTASNTYRGCRSPKYLLRISVFNRGIFAVDIIVNVIGRGK